MLAGLNTHTPVLAGIDRPVMVDADDSIIEVHGPANQGVGLAYTRVRGLNPVIAANACVEGRAVLRVGCIG